MNGFVKILALGSILLFSNAGAFAETAGRGNYLTTFPGTDRAGRNSYPAGTPQTSGKAATKPAPTNEWYSNELISNHGDGIFNYPMALKPLDNGLAMIRPMEYQAITAENPFVVGVEGVSVSQTTVSDFSDWTVTIRWDNGSGSMEAIIGQGMPMVYYSKGGSAGDATVSINAGQYKKVADNILIVTGCYNRASYALYAPQGASWSVSGNTAKSSLAGKSYWTVAMLPDDCEAETTALSWAKHAFAVPEDTRAEWKYDPRRGVVTTTYVIDTDIKEGASDALPLVGLLPHHWANLADGSLDTEAQGGFSTVRGRLKLVACNSFNTKVSYTGILGVFPPALNAASGYDEEHLRELIDEVCDNTGFDDWTDSYNDGQLLNRLSQTALAAREIGYEEGAQIAVNLLKKQLERWFIVSEGDVAFLFYYHSPWNTMIAYPAGHGQDSNLNDHNFHFGYFIDAAATVAMFDPEWGEAWGPMVDLLAADVACTDRSSSMFPYLRSFSPYSGHCWANGFATLGLGNDQESSSEAMMSHAALIKWAEFRGDMALRDAAVWMFATELSAIREYWFDTSGRTRPESFPSVLASRIFANGYDDENFWGGGIAGSYGIQLYPVQPSSAYLVQDAAYAERLWNSMCVRTGILTGSSDPNIWYDTWTQFLAMINPGKALGFYNSNTSAMGGKFGASHALTYYWIHSVASIGTPDFTVTADIPTAQVFKNGEVLTYVASNYSPSARTVTFSDGFTLRVEPYSSAFFMTGEPEVALPDVPSEPGTGDSGGQDTPGQTIGYECFETGIEASEGVFLNPYTIGFTTLSNGSVRISAVFGDENAYVGFDGPWLFNETKGFEEIRMERVGERYEAVIRGVSFGDIVKVRVKIAFAGGLAVTRQYSYESGTECTPAYVEEIISDMEVEVTRTPDGIGITASEDAIAEIIAADGRVVVTKFISASINDEIRLDDISQGLYIIRVIPRERNVAPFTRRLIL